MKHIANTTTLIVILILCIAGAASAQNGGAPPGQAGGPQPQIEIDGTGIATLQLSSPRLVLPSGLKSSSSRVNISDSELLLGITQALYRSKSLGSLVVGGITTDDNKNPGGTSFFMHQAYVDYETPTMEALIGRTDMPTHLIDFPTIRGDDLNEYVNLLDPYSSGDNVEEHRYANQASVIFNHSLRYFVNLHVVNQISSAAGSLGQNGLNAYGVQLAYQGLPGLANIERVPLWGVGYERLTVGSSAGGALNALYGGGVFNLNRSPSDRVDLRMLDTWTFGNNSSIIATPNDTFRASANSIAGAVRWLHSPFGRPAYQLAFTAGFRNYSHVANASSYALALTGVKRLGENFDLVLQYQFQHRQPAYAAAFSGVQNEQSVELGFVFGFQSILHRHIGPRRTLLNLQHQYIP
ncbi:MAG: hypothetical protein KGJ62_04540 [Armatimonadetes bacterium]|nr:hypothetical protein [Armatimonadota bacterium]MDE2205552.1 hypothetical protein [Armatimonadota bacterium]